MLSLHCLSDTVNNTISQSPHETSKFLMTLDFSSTNESSLSAIIDWIQDIQAVLFVTKMQIRTECTNEN
jgi:hypothetical protein